jgi:DNA modification methylase
MLDYLNKIIHSDAMEGLCLLPDKIVNTCITSPPYYGLNVTE